MFTTWKSSSWLILLVFAYFSYVFTFICYPIGSISSPKLNKLSPINCHFCQVSNSYIKPYVEPIVESHLKPTLIKLDDDFKICDKYTKLSEFDAKYGFQAGYEKFLDYLQDGINWFQLHVEPHITKFINQLTYKLHVYLNLIHNLISSYFLIPINQQFSKIQLLISSNPIVLQLLNSSHATNLQQRSLFLQKEFKNLIKFDEFHPREFKSNLINVVKEVLGKNYQDKEEDWEDITDEDQSDSQEEETIVITQTISVYENGAIATNNVNPELSAINDEILHWEKKIDKTIELAKFNLKQEIEPIVNNTIEELKPKISEFLQTLQKENHLQYKNLNQKISKINKDFEKIKISNDTSIETITRQEIRDDIAESYDTASNYSTKIQDLLGNEHEQVLINYFNSIQSTIDILESFADSSINEFSSSLTNLIASSESVDESTTWKIWKKFHTIKEKFFQFRDDLLNNANTYKSNNKQEGIRDLVIGLRDWNDYLNNIEFHLNFLIRDNADYLRLVRAKANVAFQMREELVYNLEKVKKELEEKEKQVKEVVEEAPTAEEKSVAEEKPVKEAVENKSVEENSVEEDSVEEDPVEEEPEKEEEVVEEIEESVEESKPVPDNQESESITKPKLDDLEEDEIGDEDIEEIVVETEAN
ncbi:hypothetical protein KGF54_002335 [Candida jiufengensis]|uniref:uncharacterized protein n=1 Tax=Candida jiufengensis TaxID=497108 RepID=UPI00222402E7|nr:uncharacterized protein KGF54_002335 [Candida jiufengensis]KAI5954560.1 hypothetical protein KGF54_002335 [Candida jiufengensis]